MNSVGKVLRSGFVQRAIPLHSASPAPPVDRVRAVQQRSKPVSPSAYNRVLAHTPYKYQNSTGSFTSHNGSVLEERIVSTRESSDLSSAKREEDTRKSSVSSKNVLTLAEQRTEEEIRAYQNNPRIAQRAAIVNLKVLALLSQSSIDITNPSQTDKTSSHKQDTIVLNGIDTNDKEAVSRAYEAVGVHLVWA
ncbi:MAG: hypothetical protein ACRCV3_03720 [Desulfovibrionaceae bacterium]